MVVTCVENGSETYHRRPISSHAFAMSIPQSQEVAGYLTTKWYGLLALFCSYLVLVRLLRFRRTHHIQQKYASFVQNPYSMPYQVAHKVAKLHMLDEQLFLHAFATQ